jgi:hypothetical protein
MSADTNPTSPPTLLTLRPKSRTRNAHHVRADKTNILYPRMYRSDRVVSVMNDAEGVVR